MVYSCHGKAEFLRVVLICWFGAQVTCIIIYFCGNCIATVISGKLKKHLEHFIWNRNAFTVIFEFPFWMVVYMYKICIMCKNLKSTFTVYHQV